MSYNEGKQWDAIHITRKVEVRYDISPEIIRQKRSEEGISIRSFAASVGVSFSYWSKVERGEAKVGAALLKKAVIQLYGLPYWLKLTREAKVLTT